MANILRDKIFISSMKIKIILIAVAIISALGLILLKDNLNIIQNYNLILETTNNTTGVSTNESEQSNYEINVNADSKNNEINKKLEEIKSKNPKAYFQIKKDLLMTKEEREKKSQMSKEEIKKDAQERVKLKLLEHLKRNDIN